LKFKKGKGWRIPNPEVVDLGNTILKMAAKRAEVDAAQSLPGVGSALRKLFEGKEGKKQPEPPNWKAFWNEVRALELAEEQMHQMLGVDSMKDWLNQGRTLNQAIEVLARKINKAREDEAELEEAPEELGEEPINPGRASKRDPATIKTVNDLYRVCHQDFGMQPTDVLKELGVSSQADLFGSPANLYMQIAVVRGG